MCGSKTEGRIGASLQALVAMLNTPEKLWIDVCQETKELVNRNRDKRGAMERPVFKSKDSYLQEHRSQVHDMKADQLQNGHAEMVDSQMND